MHFSQEESFTGREGDDECPGGPVRAFKLAIVRPVSTGECPAQVCREDGLDESVLACWHLANIERGDAAFAPNRGLQSPIHLKRALQIRMDMRQLALEYALLTRHAAFPRGTAGTRDARYFFAERHARISPFSDISPADTGSYSRSSCTP